MYPHIGDNINITYNATSELAVTQALHWINTSSYPLLQGCFSQLHFKAEEMVIQKEAWHRTVSKELFLKESVEITYFSPSITLQGNVTDFPITPDLHPNAHSSWRIICSGSCYTLFFQEAAIDSRISLNLFLLEFQSLKHKWHQTSTL